MNEERKFLVELLETELELRYDDPTYCYNDNESEIRMIESLLKRWGEVSMIQKWGRM